LITLGAHRLLDVDDFGLACYPVEWPIFLMIADRHLGLHCPPTAALTVSLLSEKNSALWTKQTLIEK
jgi:hypothetical protein